MDNMLEINTGARNRPPAACARPFGRCQSPIIQTPGWTTHAMSAGVRFVAEGAGLQG
jgi:hypothetical protein